MGYKRVPRIHTLTFDGDLEGLVIRVKSIKFGKVRQLIRIMDSDDSDDDVMSTVADELAKAIVSWNVEDDEGREVPVSREAIEEFEFGDVTVIINKWLAVLTGPDKELGKDSSSGATFPGQPLTMEAL